MADTTDNAAPPTGTPSTPRAPSVFISYAAADRSAARALRDALTAAGIDAWYDESELGGGDAWDQKIRRQIRDCDYFLPVISANTEARKEGYFRREWRLATERTLDMADDVLFLLPVVIDGTPESGARVPEKFLSVQWIRAPGGQMTPALSALLERIRAGEHHALPRPNADATRGHPAHVRPEAPPPMPPFPHVPEKRDFFHGVKFLAEVLWWLLCVAWLLVVRLPRWARVVLTVWVLVTLFSGVRCSRTPERPAAPPATRTTQIRSGGGEGQKKVRQALERAVQSARENGTAVESVDLGKIAAEIAQVFGEGFRDTPASSRPLAVIPFSRPNDTSPGGKFAHGVFLALYGRLALDRRNEVSVIAPLHGELLPAVLLARATLTGASFVVAANLEGEGESAALEAKLLSTSEGKIVWTEKFPLKGADEATVAESIARRVLERVPRQEPRRPKAP